MSSKKQPNRDVVVRRIYVCSPLRANDRQTVEKNRSRALAFEKKAIRIMSHIMGNDTLVRAFAPHAHISNMLDDIYPCEREQALCAGLGVLSMCDAIAIGGTTLSAGMKDEIICAIDKHKLPVLLLGEPDRMLSESERYELCKAIRDHVSMTFQMCTDPAITLYDISDESANCGAAYNTACLDDEQSDFITKLDLKDRLNRIFKYLEER